MKSVLDDRLLVSELASALAALPEHVRLTQVTTAKELVDAKGEARFMAWPKLLLAEHYDLQPALALHDPLLGTLGLVQCVLPPGAPSEEKGLSSEARSRMFEEHVFECVRRHVDSAAYARHLLVRARGRRAVPALTVELVLLTVADNPSQPSLVLQIGEALRRLLRESNSLHEIGVSLLIRDATAPFKSGLRRAFPWLLGATRRWLASERSKPSPSTTANPAPSRPGRLTSLALTNYRAAAERRFELRDDARVHLVHGSNGSGKSSLVEALELLVTGRVQRIEVATRSSEPTDYTAIIPTRRSPGPAQVGVTWRASSGKQIVGAAQTVVKSGIEAPLDVGVDAGSFRLDQPMMDRLVGQFPHERARTYMRAFFPEALESLSNYESATHAHESALRKLAPIIAQLEAAKRALTEVAPWRGGAAAHTNENFPELLDAWLETRALVDLCQHALNIRRTTLAAGHLGWRSSRPLAAELNRLFAPKSAEDSETLERLAKDGDSACRMIEEKLAPFRREASRAAVAASGAVNATAVHIEALDAVDRWLFSASEIQQYGRFGEKVYHVIRDGHAPTYATHFIGSEDWAAPIAAKLDALLAACVALQSPTAASAWSGAAECPEFVAASKAREALGDSGAALFQQFLRRLGADDGATGEYDGSLMSAVNELLALVTPARWSYEDLSLPSTIAGGRVSLGLQIGEASATKRAELHLNTAELNLYTVALFVLCATRVPKPLGLLLFDDPLQNMDELTSTALARGLAKVLRLWNSLGVHEEFLMLFHGEDDVERFACEIPAAVYEIPWLSPRPEKDKRDITSRVSDKAGSNVAETQRLDAVARGVD